MALIFITSCDSVEADNTENGNSWKGCQFGTPKPILSNRNHISWDCICLEKPLLSIFKCNILVRIHGKTSVVIRGYVSMGWKTFSFTWETSLWSNSEVEITEKVKAQLSVWFRRDGTDGTRNTQGGTLLWFRYSIALGCCLHTWSYPEDRAEHCVWEKILLAGHFKAWNEVRVFYSVWTCMARNTHIIYRGCSTQPLHQVQTGTSDIYSFIWSNLGDLVNGVKW